MNSKNRKEFKIFSIAYGIGVLIWITALIIGLLQAGLTLAESPKFILQAFSFPPFWILAFLPWLVFLFIRYFYRVYRLQGYRMLAQRLSIFLLLPLAFFLSSYQLSRWYTHSEKYDYVWNTDFENPNDTVFNHFDSDQKQRGMHFFGTWAPDKKHYRDLVRTNIEWLVHVPFGWQESVEHTEIKLSSRSGGTWKKESSIRTITEDARAHGIRSMMKPHLWLTKSSDDYWRGTMHFDDPSDWKAWSENYRQFILHYAKISAELEIEAFCIGTELHQTAIRHPEYWVDLIREVRSFYKGKITYAANWNKEYEEIPFWQELDFIGIQAYFPLTNKRTPSVRELVKGWRPYVKKMEALSKKYNKKILFTEIGYKSTDDAAIDPWKWVYAVSSLFTKHSYKTQVNCYEAFFRVFWEKKWFAGAHFWEWQAGINTAEGKENISFTPQNKPAENVLAKWFGKPLRK